MTGREMARKRTGTPMPTAIENFLNSSVRLKFAMILRAIHIERKKTVMFDSVHSSVAQAAFYHLLQTTVPIAPASTKMPVTAQAASVCRSLGVMSL